MIGVETTEIAGFAARRLRCGGAQAEVIVALGGAVHRLLLPQSGRASAGTPRELLAAASAEELAANRWFRGRLLFPFNDRIPGGRYTWEGRSMQLPINSPADGSAIHGFVYDRPLEVLEEGRAPGGEALLRLEARIGPHELPGYPFEVSLEATYLLGSDHFTLELAAANRGREKAPLAFGWHPYFMLGAAVDALAIQANCTAYVPVDSALLPTGEILPVAGTALDFRAGRSLGANTLDVALTAPPDGRLALSSGSERIAVELGGEAFRYVQLFTHPDRRSIAIEPVTAATNSFNIPALGLLSMEPGGRITGRASVRYERGSRPVDG